MSVYALPVLYTLFVWWFSTGVIVYLDGLPTRTFRWSMLGTTVLLALGFCGIVATRTDASVAGAYGAFTCGLMVWAWHEVSFLLGFVTGPRRTACPSGCAGWRHAGHAVQTILYHELAILLSAAVLIALTWGAANQVGTWTFIVLWLMRLSAKLNVFLGVRNLNEEFLPDHLRFLRSFFARKPMNLLFPVSITVSTVVATLLVACAVSPEASVAEAVGFTFLGTLMTLAVLEHWFLVLPLPVTAPWQWAIRARSALRPPKVPAGPDLVGAARPSPGAQQ